MKISGSYASLLRGVSQQPPANRQSGQHTEQVNMIPDPVAGLIRRAGSIYKTSYLDAAIVASSGVGTLLAQATGYRKIAHTSSGVDYLIMARTEAAPASSLPAVICYNITTGQFLPVTYATSPGGAQVEDLIKSSGVSAIVSLGKYIAWGCKAVTCNIGAGVDLFPANSKASVWVRGGAYNRVYSVTTSTGISFQYTTPDASAAGAAASIAPAAIATALATAGNVAGVTGMTISGSTFAFNATGGLSVSDSGDGSLLRGLYAEVSDVALLPLIAPPGQRVKVTPAATTGYYVQAFELAATGLPLAEVVWREVSGMPQADPAYGRALFGLGVMTVRGSGLYVGMTSQTDPSGFSGALPNTIGDPPPVPLKSAAGDSTSNPAPSWMRSKITYMGIFQDRFIVAAGAAVSVSAAGDYYNFFRSTVVTVPASDAFEMVAQGSEDDYIRHSVAYNKNLVLFGDRRQYVVLGGAALTPTSANMSVMSAYPDATIAPPVAAGGLIYYARSQQGHVGVHQIQPGSYVDSAESFPTSPQIGKYIPADPAEMEHVPGAPALLILRSRQSQRSLYVFHYLDQADGRKQEAWHRWDFGEALGAIMAVHSTKDGLLILSFRPGYVGGVMFNGYLVADLLPTVPASSAPYLDSRKVFNNEYPDSLGAYNIAFGSSTDRFLLGGALSTAAYWQATYPAEYATMEIGIPFESSVTLTAPYLRDNKGVAIVTGRQVISSLKVSFDSSGDVKSAVTFNATNIENLDKARIVGDALNIVGRQPVTSRVTSVPIGRAVGEYDCTIKSVDWLPMCITNVSWVGQSFNRTPSA